MGTEHHSQWEGTHHTQVTDAFQLDFWNCIHHHPPPRPRRFRLYSVNLENENVMCKHLKQE